MQRDWRRRYVRSRQRAVCGSVVEHGDYLDPRADRGQGTASNLPEKTVRVRLCLY